MIYSGFRMYFFQSRLFFVEVGNNLEIEIKCGLIIIKLTDITF